MTEVLFPLAILLGLWILFNLCSCRNFAGSDLNRTRPDALELRLISFNIRYGSADNGENHWKNRREMVFDVSRKVINIENMR